MWKVFRKYTTECIVVFSFIIILIFTIVDILLCSSNILVQDILIEKFYDFFGFELLALSGIKISKHIGSAFGNIKEKVDGMGVNLDEEEIK